MTGLLGDLAARFAPGAKAPIEPRPFYRFEGDNGDAAFEEVASETVAPGPHIPTAPAAVQRPSASDEAPFAPARIREALAERAPTNERSEAKRPLREAEPIASVESRRPTPFDANSAGQEQEPSVVPSVKDGRAETRAEPRQVIDRLEITQPAASQDAPKAPRKEAPLAQENLASRAPCSEAEDAVRSEDTGESAEKVPIGPTIRIGRIEVRTPPPPAAPPPRQVATAKPTIARAAPTARPAASGPGLTDYLGWKR